MAGKEKKEFPLVAKADWLKKSSESQRGKDRVSTLGCDNSRTENQTFKINLLVLIDSAPEE